MERLRERESSSSDRSPSARDIGARRWHVQGHRERLESCLCAHGLPGSKEKLGLSLSQSFSRENKALFVYGQSGRAARERGTVLQKREGPSYHWSQGSSPHSQGLCDARYSALTAGALGPSIVVSLNTNKFWQCGLQWFKLLWFKLLLVGQNSIGSTWRPLRHVPRGAGQG
jgi:hypothetical protein